jgi:thiol-disulfide isomerase/thioredoxin
MRPKTFVLPACLAVLCSWSTAQRAVEASSPVAAVEQAFAKLTAVDKEVGEALRPLQAKLRDKEITDEQRAQLMKEMSELRQRGREPRKAFDEMFAAADWKAFDKERHADLLKSGLQTQTRNSKSPQLAVEACRRFLEWFPDDRAAEGIRGHSLPNALLGVGNFDEARKVLTDLASSAEGGAKARALLTIGDIAAATGDLDEAKRQYDAAEAAADERTMSYVTLRKELVGKPAPDIDSKTWVGGKASPLSGLRGKVVVVDFWATWCGPCRMVMPALSDMYQQYKEEGLEVLGVTRFYANGYMPRTKEETQMGGESVKGLTEESFQDHVAQFKKVTEIAYPCVIGADDDFKAYKVSGIPTLAVVDRKGNVAMVAVGSGSEALLHLCVERQLAAK